MKSKTSRINMVLLVTLTALLFSITMVPAGFAKVRVEEGDWVKYSAFTGLDHNVIVNEYLYVDNVSLARDDWTKVGTSPYVDSINSTNYIKAKADGQEIGDFEFENFVDGEIRYVYIELNCTQIRDEKIKVWYSTDNGSNWVDSGNLTASSMWAWRDTGDQSANIDTWAKVNDLRVYLESVADGIWSAEVKVDCMRLRIVKAEARYAPPNLWNLTWDKPDYWPENNTELINMTVQSVSGSIVTVKSTTHFENGTEKMKTLVGNVTSGSGNLGFFLIETNQTEEGEEILWDHTQVTGAGSAGIKLYINGTVSLEYAGVSREVNYVNVIIPSSLAMATYVNISAYWDKATGVLCEISMSVTFGPIRILREYIDVWTSFKITETNMFKEAAPAIWTEWWFWTIVAVIVIVVAGSGILIWRRGKATAS